MKDDRSRVCQSKGPFNSMPLPTLRASERSPGFLIKSALLTLCFLAASAVQAQVVHFARDIAHFEVPKGYGYSFENRRRTLALSPEGPPHIEIRLTFNPLRELLPELGALGQDIIRHAALKNGKKLFEVPGNGGVAFVDYSESRQAGPDRIQETHGMMGLNDGYVTFTVTYEEKEADSSTVKEMLGRSLVDLLGRMRSGGR